jgi:hypothetical protein
MSKEPRQKEAFSLSKFFKKILLANDKKSSKNDSKNGGADSQKNLRRDFCFMTANGPAYFSTRDEFCLQASGDQFRAFDLLEYGPQHPLRGWRTTVVGERGGRLWIVDEGSQNAYPLQTSSSSTIVSLKSKYGFKKLSSNNRLTESVPPPGLNDQQKRLLCVLPDLMIRVNHGKTMQHLTPVVSVDGTVGWAGVGYVDGGLNNDEAQNDFTKSIVLSISGTAAAQ